MMKKQFLLPLASLVLTACGNLNSMPSAEKNDVTSPSVMQPANATSSQSHQSSNVPAKINDSALHKSHKMDNANQANQQSKSINQDVCKDQEMMASQKVAIPRHALTNAPDYSKIDKGFYKGNHYTVKKGDTMFLIAYIAGIDVKELAALNGMKEPYTLSIGQTLKTSNDSASNTQKCKQIATTTQVSENQQVGANLEISGNATVPNTTKLDNQAQPISNNQVITETAVSKLPTNKTTSASASINWIWPVKGKVVQDFSELDGGNKGIDIAGSRGQPVYAAAAGRVVYAGNALRGYGNLVIIKHNDDFLSAYAHNDSIIVRNQQQVSAGQQIAKMGNSGTNEVKLHFEIRHLGKPVDPIGYLPK